MYIYLKHRSNNAKTGPIPVTTTSDDTCPDTCPLKGNGCYAAQSYLGMHWARVSSGERDDGFANVLAAIVAFPENQLWRHNQAGDLPGKNKRIDRRALRELVKANKGRRGFTYTHKPLTKANQVAIREANDNGFTINLSANGPAHADKLLAIGAGPVVTLLPADATGAQFTRKGTRIVICPATQRDDVTCKSCGLCARANREVVVGFPVHGAGKTRAAAVTREN